MDIYESFYQEYLKLNPYLATFENVHKYDDKLENYYKTTYHLSIINLYKKYKKQFNDLNLEVETEILEREIKSYEEYLESPYRYLCLQHDNTVFNSIMFLIKDDRQIITSKEDLNKWKKRMEYFGDNLDSLYKLLNEGIKEGYTMPKVTIELYIDTLKENRKYESYSLPNKNKISKSIVNQYDRFMKNNYLKLVDKFENYLKNTYLKHCKEELGCGKELYNIPTKMHISSNISFPEIHELGKKEVKRIRNEISKVFKRIKFTGSIKEFYEHIMKKPNMFEKNPEDVVEAYKSLVTAINETVITENFYPYDISPLDIKRTPKYQEKYSPMAYYIEETEERNGTYYLTLRDLKSHPKMDYESLFLHEAIPGHHYQISLHNKLENSKFFKVFNYTDNLEGWATYAETLGEYKDDYSLLGKYFLEIFRAVRLVVDTGIHYYGWDYSKCYKMLRRYTTLAEDDIRNEIYRYVVNPGQALAYKIGELEFKRLKKVYLKKNKDNTVKDYHHEILRYGPIPMRMLKEMIE